MKNLKANHLKKSEFHEKKPNRFGLFLSRFLLRHIARKEGFLDPILFLANFKRFAQPSELVAPKELLRAGVHMQARGLLNVQAIQHNMDWVWPYWVERQFNPHDESFIPRAFNLSHLNLTHRNWTAIGVPGSTELPIVDPRGLVTPVFDSWSLDFWVISDTHALIPSRLLSVEQNWLLDGNPRIVTRSDHNKISLTSSIEAYEEDHVPICQIKLSAWSPTGGWLVISLRPYNPEGISFIDKIALLKERPGWRVNGHHDVYFDVKPDGTNFSRYRKGDVFRCLPVCSDASDIECEVGMATAAFLYQMKPDESRDVIVRVPLIKHPKVQATNHSEPVGTIEKWEKAMSGSAKLKIPDKHFQFLYDAALKSLILHSPEDVYPGPYTYKRFWFRDAAFILNALILIGLEKRAEKVIDRFPLRQTIFGYFLSQDGEWDSNGEALWTIHRYCELTGKKPKEEWRSSIVHGAKWLIRKRISKTGTIYDGLLPVGFSAEHLGPNDYYYWDDFWGIAGLRAAASLMTLYDDKPLAQEFAAEALDLLSSVERSLEGVIQEIGGAAMPASPNRRLDAGAIGSLAAGYPLQIFEPQDARLINTANFLHKESFIDGSFYQEISHSGMNAYLTLHIAQIFLRAGDLRFFDLMKSVASLATSTGQWPEAIHPRTKGGCMGDGQHIWAAAEWVIMMRNCFVREENEEKKLILCSGIPPAWIHKREWVSFGPTETSFGKISVFIKKETGKIKVRWEASWHSDDLPVIEIRLPHFPIVKAEAGKTEVEFDGEES